MKRPISTIAALFRTAHARWLGVMTFMLAVLAAAVAHSATLGRFDTHTNHEVAETATHRTTEANLIVTQLGSTATALTLTVLAVIVLAAIRHWRGALVLGVTVAMTQAAVDLVKLVVERPRPGHGLIEATGYSFPSAHSATSVALYMTVAFIAARSARGVPRVLIWAMAALLVVVVGGSRVYLGAHYPSDVVAGWLTGAIVGLGCWAAVSRLRLLDRPLGAT
jgi:membrane-associated phospholipid phosphatase